MPRRRRLQTLPSTGLGLYGGGIDFQSLFDAAGNRHQLDVADVDGTMIGLFENKYQFDGLGRTTEITQQTYNYDDHHDVAEKRHVDFTYDLAGQLDTIQRYASTGTASPVAAFSSISIGLDESNR